LNPFQLNYLDVFGNHMIVEEKEEKLAMSNVLSNRYDEMTLGAHDTIESLLKPKWFDYSNRNDHMEVCQG